MEKFSYETNGYNRTEVNQFINDVIAQTEEIIEKFKVQSNELEQLKKELEHYRKLEDTLKHAVITAEENGKNTRRLAEEEASMIINDAKNNANRIVNEALLKAEKIQVNREILEKNINIFKRKLKLIIEQQMAVVDEIEVLELE